MTRLAMGFAALILLLVVLADTRNLGPLLAVYDFPYGDKIGHVVLYGGLTFLACLAAQRTDLDPRLAIVLVAAVMVALTSLEELSQLAFPSRTPDPYDLLASYAGVAWSATVALLIGRIDRATRVPQRIV